MYDEKEFEDLKKIFSILESFTLGFQNKCLTCEKSLIYGI